MTDDAADRFSAEQARLYRLTGWRKPLSLAQRERLRLGALASLQLRNTEARIIRGATVDSRAVSELLGRLNDLLPTEAPALRVTFIDRVACPKCMALMDAQPEPEPVPIVQTSKQLPVADRPAEKSLRRDDCPAPALPPVDVQPSPAVVVPFPGAMSGFGSGGSSERSGGLMGQFDIDRRR